MDFRRRRLVIEQAAWNKDLTTTLRYMRLSPAAREGAINLLNRCEDPPGLGDILETAAV